MARREELEKIKGTKLKTNGNEKVDNSIGGVKSKANKTLNLDKLSDFFENGRTEVDNTKIIPDNHHIILNKLFGRYNNDSEYCLRFDADDSNYPFFDNINKIEEATGIEIKYEELEKLSYRNLSNLNSHISDDKIFNLILKDYSNDIQKLQDLFDYYDVFYDFSKKGVTNFIYLNKSLNESINLSSFFKEIDDNEGNLEFNSSFGNILKSENIDSFLELCDELELGTIDNKWFNIGIKESLEFYNRFGKIGFKNLKILNTYLNKPIRINYFMEMYHEMINFYDEKEIHKIFEINTSVLEKLISLIKKEDLNLSYNGLLAILSEKIEKYSTDSDIDRSIDTYKHSIGDILNNINLKNNNEDLPRNQEETYEVLELFYNELGKDFITGNEKILINILNTNKKKNYFKENIFDKYAIKGYSGILFLDLIFDSNGNNLENYQKLESAIPEVFGYDNFVEGERMITSKTLKTIIRNNGMVENFLIYALKYKKQLLESPKGTINNNNFKIHFNYSGENGIGLKNIENIEDIFGIDISYEDFNESEGVFIVGLDLENEFEYLNNKFPDKIKTLDDLKEFNPFYRLLPLGTSRNKKLYTFFLDKLNYTENDFKNEEKILIIRDLYLENLENFKILEKEFGLDIVLEYLGNKNYINEALSNKDEFIMLGGASSKLMKYIGNLDVNYTNSSNKYKLLEPLLSKLIVYFQSSEITEEQVNKFIKLIEIQGLDNIHYLFLESFIFTETIEDENQLLYIYDELIKYNYIGRMTISPIIKLLKLKIYDFNNIKVENKNDLDREIYKNYFINTLKTRGTSLFNKVEKEGYDFPINSDNFLDYFEDDEVVLEFEKDNGTKFEGYPKPWTKVWFLERPERKEYLSYEKYSTFEKFGTIIGLGQIEGSNDSSSFRSYYKSTFENISLEKSRTNILQLGEVFSLVLRQENYNILDELVENEVNIGEEFKNFIEKYNISDKGRTILTLLIIREIKNSFSIFKDENGDKNIDSLSVKEMLLKVFNKFKKYNEVIKIYDNVPIKTSIGMEYEVTESIAKGYGESVGSDYKNDIEIISDYSGIAQGNDAVHEIATKPTDNPYLLILEMQLLQDLDFVDLNFKKQNYLKGSRGLHITLGSEQGIKLNENTNFIQNILIASNIGGVNAGEEISNVNRYGNIREKGWDCDVVFGKEKTECVEYRSLSLDKAEQFERLVLSVFNLNMINQEYSKFLNYQDINNNFILFSQDKDKFLDDFNKAYGENIDVNPHGYFIYSYFMLKNNINEIIKNHNENFEKNEIIDESKLSGLGGLIRLYNSTSPIIKLLVKNDISIYYLKEIFEFGISNKEDFIKYLKGDGKFTGYTDRQINIIYENYNLRISKVFNSLKEENLDAYNNIGEYLNGNIEETIRKLTNNKRFKEVIGDDDSYLESIYINEGEIEKEITAELINKFTRINNLFVKKDSTNALSMLDTTKEDNGELISDPRLTEMTVFDRLDIGIETRKGYNVIQGASEEMLTQAIQKRILEFNEEVENNLTKKS